jgi:cobalt-zinc-cadmium efflux system protein
MSMEHNHSHSHGLTGEQTKVNNAYIIGISLNFIFVLIEVTAGLFINSLSLLSDAGHNFADVVALALSLLAFRLMDTARHRFLLLFSIQCFCWFLSGQ